THGPSCLLRLSSRLISGSEARGGGTGRGLDGRSDFGNSEHLVAPRAPALLPCVLGGNAHCLVAVWAPKANLFGIISHRSSSAFGAERPRAAAGGNAMSRETGMAAPVGCNASFGANGGFGPTIHAVPFAFPFPASPV